MNHFGFVMEQALGHRTHHQNLARWVADDAALCPVWMPIEEHLPDRWETLPGVRNNWSLKASLRARHALREAMRTQTLDALFLHTQTVSLFALPWMRRIPSIVSLDATPLNYDTVGAEYGHAANGDSWVERRKYQWYCNVFSTATALTTWCQWAKDSLVKDYRVPADKVTVIAPGVDLNLWEFGAERATAPRADGPIRLLFVGGDFARKGGDTLLEAFRGGLHRECVLDIVTKDESVAAQTAGMESIRVHYGLTANSAPLRELYACADLFVFPTRADCLPIAIMEAMAAGLPVIATDVGALREEVEQGVNGLMVPPGDAAAVTQAVRTLLADPTRLRAMSQASRSLAEARFDARRNYNAILSLLKGIQKA